VFGVFKKIFFRFSPEDRHLVFMSRLVLLRTMLQRKKKKIILEVATAFTANH